MASLGTELRDALPASEIQPAPQSVVGELGRGEELIWVGGPDRWGLFRATPAVVAIAVAIGASVYMSAGTGLTPWQYATRVAGSTGGGGTLMLAALALVLVVVLGLTLRDPRDRWTYVVTDRRLMTFYRGRKLRETTPARLHRLRVLKGVEGRVRDIGDVIWARIADTDDNVRGPDQGRHGFRGMRDPDGWKRRLVQWREAIERQDAADAAAFRDRPAPDPSSRPSPTDSNVRVLDNRRYGLTMELPGRWVGRVGLNERVPFRVLGFEMPFQQIEERSNEPLHDPPESWNFIRIAGRSGMKFNVDIHDGPPTARFDAFRGRVGERLIDADGDFGAGDLRGFRVDHLHLDKYHCRFAMLRGAGFHAQFNILIPRHQADGLLPAVDAVFDSIRSVPS